VKPTFVYGSHVFGFDAHAFAVPNLLSATKQLNAGNGEDILAVIPAQQKAIDSSDLLPDCDSEANASHVVHVERHLGAGLKGRTADGLQRIATRQRSSERRATG